MSSMTTTAPESGGTRMRSEDRRVLILEAATAVFGERGYHGATTDAVAREAGVFGSKEAMFLAVLDRALDRIIETFRTSIEENRASGHTHDREELARCVGRGYVDLLADRGLLLSLMQAFMLGSDPVVGAAGRAGLRRVYGYLRDEVGLDAEATTDFLAHGMLLNTVVGLRMADDYDSDPAVRELLDEMLPTKIDVLLQLRDTDS
jgi:TetR/AcrR family transcriptional regulator